MKIYRDPAEIPDDERGRAVTIGAFDGVHLGHQAVLRLVRELAVARGLAATVLTFDRHPAEVVRPESAPKVLTTLEQKLELLEATGSVDVFDLARRLGHRMGLASWAGPGSADGDAFERLVRAFDTLDGSEAFVHPDKMAAVAVSGKRAERAALDEVADTIAAAVRRYDAGDTDDQALFGRIVDAWTPEPQEVRLRGIALDIALIHIASMSNLAAALGWALVDLLEHPTQLSRVRLGNRDFAQSCALESTRLAQRSIMSRTVLSPVRFDTGEVTYEVPPGWTIATLLPLLNTSVAPGLEQWDPDRWDRHRLIDRDALPSPMLVTAFGHGRHSCPAQPFSLAAMTAATTRLLREYQMTPCWTAHPQPVGAQIGGVARAAGPCLVSYVPRSTASKTSTER